MSSKANDSELPYAELTKIENEQNWRFARLLIGLSVGILAFSVQTFEGIADYNCIIYISWLLLFISFSFGIYNLHLFQKILSNKSKKAFEEAKVPKKNVDKEKIAKYEENIEKFEKTNKWVPYVFRICFIAGIIAFALFKFFVVKSSIPLGQVIEKGNKMEEIVSNQEFLVSKMLEIQAQIRILEKRGITNKGEILNEFKKLQVEIEEKLKKIGREN